MSGTRIAPSCTNCRFAFEVDFTFQRLNNSSWPEICETGMQADDFTFSYGFVDDYYGEGPKIMLQNDYGNWYAWADAAFDEASSKFDYATPEGTLDLYNGTSLSSASYYGVAIIE